MAQAIKRDKFGIYYMEEIPDVEEVVQAAEPDPPTEPEPSAKEPEKMKKNAFGLVEKPKVKKPKKARKRSVRSDKGKKRINPMSKGII